MLKLSIGLFLAFSLNVKAEEVVIKIKNMGGEKGQLAVAAFSNPQDFPENSARASLSKFFHLPGNQNETTVTVDLKPGRYALATFLDKNKNQNLDTNIVGAPKERFGFSKNPKIGFSAPNFAECAFDVQKGKRTELTINLIKLF